MNSSGSSPAPMPPHHRKLHYVDHALQKWLLIALVILEVLILAAAGAVLYFRLHGVVEDSLYRVHLAGQPPMLTVLLKESLVILAGLVAVNLLALLVADRIWAHYVGGIVAALRSLLTSVQKLDLREERLLHIAPRHEVLSVGLQWHRAERERHLALLESMRDLEQLASQPDASIEDFRAGLLAFSQTLPKTDMKRA